MHDPRAALLDMYRTGGAALEAALMGAPPPLRPPDRGLGRRAPGVRIRQPPAPRVAHARGVDPDRHALGIGRLLRRALARDLRRPHPRPRRPDPPRPPRRGGAAVTRLGNRS